MWMLKLYFQFVHQPLSVSRKCSVKSFSTDIMREQTYSFSLRKITGAPMLGSLVVHVGQILHPAPVTIHSHIGSDLYLGVSAPSYDHLLILWVTYCAGITSKNTWHLTILSSSTSPSVCLSVCHQVEILWVPKVLELFQCSPRFPQVSWSSLSEQLTRTLQCLFINKWQIYYLISYFRSNSNLLLASCPWWTISVVDGLCTPPMRYVPPLGSGVHEQWASLPSESLWLVFQVPVPGFHNRHDS